ncbi:MAG: penicillin-binding transpeptidase domain-containing protein [Candidatus Goldiibacteriota bacterium]
MANENRDMNGRIEMIYFLFTAILVVFAFQLVILQVFQYGRFRDMAQKQHLETVKQQIGRGAIFTSDGKKLAMSIKAYSICANPGEIKDRYAVAEYLSKQLGLSRQEISAKLNTKKAFVYIDRKVDLDKASAIVAKDITGIFPLMEEKRYYPLQENGANIVGFTGIDGNGLEGLEQSYEKYLRGKVGSMLVKRDVKGRPIMTDTVEIKKAEAGGDIYLTIDSNIQYHAQQELKTAVEKYKGKNGILVSLNPKTGAIYAMANYPTFNPNDFNRYPPEDRKNRAVTDIFEPGSTFKIFTMSAVLKDRPETYNEKVFCGNGKQLFFDRYVHDHEKHGWLTVPEVIKYSSNIGMVELAMRVKQEKLYGEYSAFGFGKSTGSDLPGEVAGILRPVSQWDNSTISSIPYGQEVAVTAMQLARAYAAIANGGYMITPYIVEKVIKNGSVVYSHPQTPKVKVVDDAVREKLIKMLEMVVEKDGTGKKAAMSGYQVAGKTGTAQKRNASGKGYAADKYVCSFIGFVPASDPDIVTLVVVDEPAAIWAFGGDVAAPAFRNLSSEMISYLHVVPVSGSAAQAAADQKADAAGKIKMADLYMKQYSEAKRALSLNSIKLEKIGYGKIVIMQEPAAGTDIKTGGTACAYLADKDAKEGMRFYMPDLKGASIRKAIEILKVYGLKAKCVGSGTATAQDPKPGVAVKKGSECTVNFELAERT